MYGLATHRNIAVQNNHLRTPRVSERWKDVVWDERERLIKYAYTRRDRHTHVVAKQANQKALVTSHYSFSNDSGFLRKWTVLPALLACFLTISIISCTDWRPCSAHLTWGLFSPRACRRKVCYMLSSECHPGTEPRAPAWQSGSLGTWPGRCTRHVPCRLAVELQSTSR